MSENIKNLHKEFLEYMEIEKGRSLKTLENYDRYLNCFFDFSKISHPQQINDELVRKYRLYLNRRELDKKTQNYYLIALRMFLKYLAKRGIKSMPPERIELAKVPQRELNLITFEELKRLLSAPDGKDLKSLRDKAILEMLFSTGLRVSELCSLNREDVNEGEAEEVSVRGKGGKVRVVFISERARQALKNYLNKRTDIDPALFIRIKKDYSKADDESLRLTPRSMERIIKYYATKAGIAKKVTPHTLRHCFATDLLSAGADLRSVQALLGHSSITTTQVYTHITDKQLKDIHKKFHGKSEK